MLDNRNSGLDPSFIDQAWEDMRKQLDEAMPLAPNNRRRVLAWWWAAGLLLLALISIGWYASTQAIDLQALPIPTYPVAVAETQRIPAPAAPVLPQQSTPTTATVAAEADQLSTLSSKTKLADTPSGTATKPPDYSTEKEVIDENKLASSAPPSDALPKEATQNNPKDNLAEALPATPRKTMSSLRALPTMTASALMTHTLGLETAVQTKARSSHYALEVGISTRNFTGLDGYFIGLNKEWQRTKSRWSFGAGLQYRQQRIPFQNQDLSKVSPARAANSMDNPTMEEALGNNAVLDFSSGVANFAYGDSIISIPITSLELVQKLHYVEVPLYTNFRLGRKWEASATVRLSFLAKAYLDHTTRRAQNESADFALGNNSGGGNYDPSFTSYLDSQKTSKRLGTNTEDFHSTMLSGAVGITYYPLSQLGWRLQYSSTPMSLYKLASIQRGDHWLGTSLVWRFGGR